MIKLDKTRPPQIGRSIATDIALYVVIALSCSIFGAAIVYGFVKGISPEAFGGVLSGVGTLALAWFTWRSISKTSDVIANGNFIHRTNVTIDFMNQWLLTPVQVTSIISITPQNAASQLLMCANSLHDLRALKAAYNPTGTDNRDEQYRTVVESFSVVLNFFMIALQLLRGTIIEAPLFLSTFASTFASTFDAMLVVNAEIEAIPTELIERRRDLYEICTDWLAR